MPPYLYVSAWNPSGLTIVDADPAVWATVGHILDTGGTPLNAPSTMVVHRGIAYIPCQLSYVSIVDVSDPTNPVFLSTIGSIGAPFFTAGCDCCHLRQGGLLYVTSITDNALSIFDVSNPAVPVFVGSIQGGGAAPWLGGARSVDVDDSLVAYVAAPLDNSLTCIDVSNPAAPVFLGRITGVGPPNRLNGVHRVIKIGNYAYTLSATANINVFDVSNPAAPTLHGQLVDVVNLVSPANMCIYGNYAYVSCATNPNGTLTIIDIANPAAPAYVNKVVSWRINSTSGNAVFSRSFPNIYVCGSNNVTDALVWYEVANPLAINYVSQIVGQGAPNYMGAPRRVTHDIYFEPIAATQPATRVT